MALTFELATFIVRDGEEDALLAERPQMIAALAAAFPGVLGSWLTKRADGSWIDVILWRSREEAEQAAEYANGVPEAKAWFRHIEKSAGLQHLEVAHEELFELVRRTDAGT